MRKLGLSVVLQLLSASAILAQSAWLPEPGRLVSSGTVVHQSFDEFYRGAERRPTPFGELQQTTYLVGLETGIGGSFAVYSRLGGPDCRPKSSDWAP